MTPVHHKEVTEVLIIGGGPAGRALARACVHTGPSTALVDPRPGQVWTATYAAWADELPEGSPTKATSTTVRAYAREEHVLDRTYVVLDNAKLHALPPEVTVHQGKAATHTTSEVQLTDGRTLVAKLVIDASGANRGRAEQTAVGTIVESDTTDVVLMDWRGVDKTFRYEVPLGGNRRLIEQTSLASRPGRSLTELQRNVRADERVRFPLDAPRSRNAFGAKAGLIHPATGYSVATSLALAPQVAEAIGEALPRGARAAYRATQHTIWPNTAKMVHALRRRGLEALLKMSPEQTVDFFELFFRLPPELQRAYLSGRDDVAGTTRAMAEVWRAAPWRLRAKLMNTW